MARPEKPIISRERAARAALGVIDTHGLDALSLELVARRLGVKAPSLYYHFKNKAAILSDVALLILREEIEAPQPNSEDWEEMLTGLCVDTRRGILRHPNAAPLMLQYFPRHILLGAYDYWTAQCPYPAEIQMVILDGTEKLTFGSALFEAAARANSVEPMPEFDPKKYPDLARAVRANPYDNEELFAQTIKAFLAGFRNTPHAEKKKSKKTPKIGKHKSEKAEADVPQAD